MADEETIVINGVEVIKLKCTCNYGSWLATSRLALEVPDPKSWRLITDKNSAPKTNRDMSSFLHSKDFARQYAAAKKEESTSKPSASKM